jgi:hypothetical protein
MPAPLGKTSRHPSGDAARLEDTLAAMLKKTETDAWQTARLAQTINTPEKAFRFVTDHISYEEDKPGVEQLRSPARLWADRKGDCDCMSLFIGTLLKNQGVPFVYRLTKNNGPGQASYNHVYPVAWPGTARETPVDPVWGIYGAEAPYFEKKDIRTDMRLEELNGLEGVFKKKDGSPTGFAKGVSAINRANPALMALRGGLLLGLQQNALGVAAKLRLAYADAHLAQMMGVSPQTHAKIKEALRKLEEKFKLAGGNTENLKSAILKGKGNNDGQRVPLGALPGVGAMRRAAEDNAPAPGHVAGNPEAAAFLEKISAELDAALAPVKEGILSAFSNDWGGVSQKLAAAFSGSQEAAKVMAFAVEAAAQYGVSPSELRAAVMAGARKNGLGSAFAAIAASALAFLKSIQEFLKDIKIGAAATGAQTGATGAQTGGEGFETPPDEKIEQYAPAPENTNTAGPTPAPEQTGGLGPVVKVGAAALCAWALWGVFRGGKAKNRKKGGGLGGVKTITV